MYGYDDMYVMSLRAKMYIFTNLRLAVAALYIKLFMF